jgi:CRP-like cAMP-binding protein
MSLLTGAPRAATVRSVGETVVYEIGRQQFEPLLSAHPEWLEELAVIMEERLVRRRARLAESEARRSRPLLARLNGLRRRQ